MGTDNNINNEIIDQLVIKVNELDKREYPDYSKVTVELKQCTEVLKSEITEVKEILKTVPKNIPVKYQVTLSLKTKEIIAASIIWFMVTAIQTGVNIYLWKSKSSLEANDLKYRAIRQVFPKQADWVDSVYRFNAEFMIKQTDSLEEAAKVNSRTLIKRGLVKRKIKSRRAN
ncbi:hypothetical protein ACPPVU_24900 [Mucilaginibacter sp. McL0603]|uniref:hypothetical protein n=1 Tax=Mucilaginibacter sp. McL0603 TaxID=3415670 RepID=UPI003CF01CA0